MNSSKYQNSQNAKNKKFGNGLKSVLNHNNSVKPNNELLDSLKNFLPQFFDKNGIFKHDKFDAELQENNVIESRDGYKLGFVGKDYARLQTSRKTETMIAPDIKHNSQPENKNSENIFITGDNLETLRHLQNAYSGKIKMIYIDPPYNTGKEFVYNDTFEFNDEKLKSALGYNDDEIKRLKLIQGKSSHSAWLTFMYPRLKLAQKLLTDDGVIFVSIDDNEQANLKLLMDEILGEVNFVANFIWNSSTGGGIRAKYVNISHQHILMYAKSIFNLDTLYAPLSDEAISQYRDKNEKGIYRDKDFAWKNTSNNPNQRYEIVTPDGEIIIPKRGYLLRFIRERFEQELVQGNVTFKRTTTSPFVRQDGSQANWNIYIKKYLGDSQGAPVSVLPRSLVGLNNDGTNDIQTIFGERIFDFPKSVRLMNYLLKIGTETDSLILDFFAGSGTTAHAVMQLNAEDGGNRKFIMVQIDEPTNENSEARKAGFSTIDEISRERIKRASQKIKSEKGLALSENFDGGFKHFRLVSPDVTTLDKIEKFDPAQPQRDFFDKMVDAFDDKTTDTKGEEIILQTWLIHDGYTFNQQPEKIDFDGYQAYYIDQSLLYIICQGWENNQTKKLLNEIGTHQLNLNTIIVYGYSFSMESLRELELGVKQSLNRQVSIEKRY
jgi:adenine-specific DNA-methyltransferase